MNNKYFLHNVYMAEIADCIINNKVPLTDESEIKFSKNANYQHGVKEIIGLYLLIPYINNDNGMLKYDTTHTQVSIFDEKEIVFYTVDGIPIYYKNLRDTICHSFVSCDTGVYCEPVIVFDDRIIMSKSDHDKLSNTDAGSKAVLVKNTDVLDFLKTAYSKILREFENDK